MDESEVHAPVLSGSAPGGGEEAHPGSPCAPLTSPLLHPSPPPTEEAQETEESQADGDKEPGEECPVCTEPFQAQGDHVAAVLHCNHPVCQRCLQSVQRVSQDPSRLRCPLCRQTTPLPQWDMLILQEDMYSGGVGVCQAGRGDPGSDLRPWYRYRLMRIHSLYLYVSVLLLLLVVLGYLLSRNK